MTAVPTITIDEILERYEAVFLDAYGVLVHDSGPIPGAAELIDRLEQLGREYFILTNDASRSPGAAAERLGSFGVRVAKDRTISSAGLIGDYFEAQGLDAPRAIVLGGAAARDFVASLGAEIVDPTPTADFDVMLACGTRQYDFVELFDHAMSALFRQIDRQHPVHLLLPNPDVIYPKDEGAFGFTAGGIALLMESALDVRFPGKSPKFVRFGKPHQPIFEEAIARAGTRNVIMIGDQLATDIAGANEAGIDSALVSTGVAVEANGPVRPTYLLPTLR